jgi:hypothetical protein
MLPTEWRAGIAARVDTRCRVRTRCQVAARAPSRARLAKPGSGQRDPTVEPPATKPVLSGPGKHGACRPGEMFDRHGDALPVDHDPYDRI